MRDGLRSHVGSRDNTAHQIFRAVYPQRIGLLNAHDQCSRRNVVDGLLVCCLWIKVTCKLAVEQFRYPTSVCLIALNEITDRLGRTAAMQHYCRMSHLTSLLLFFLYYYRTDDDNRLSLDR